MPHLTDAQLAYIRGIKADNYSDTVSVWRSPAVSGGKIGSLTQVTASQACRLWPDATSTLQGRRLVAALGDLHGGRIDLVAAFPDTADIREGDELRVGTTKYKVERAAVWQTTLAAALSKVHP